MKIKTVYTDDNKYLQILGNIAKPPGKLYFIGNLPSDRVKSVAIVGSRKPTSYGKEITYQLAYDLASRGVTIISGLAYGVDSIAHQAAIDANGNTIAILGSGLDNIYPKTNRQLADNIVDKGGAVLSEYPPENIARNYQFLERNRLVSGLADIVVVTEAAARSGTLSTVAHALEQGKDVGAVPGNITSLMSVGCNQIISRGGQVITNYEDILSAIDQNYTPEQTTLVLGDNEAEATIIDLLRQGVREGDELLRKSKLSPSEFSTSLTMLEIRGVIRSLGGNQWTLK